ncbi:hypothetical protein [Enterococcus pallens]|uniref:hypothetical protein n=1 Tax=Enterococcus pallens TaxID=160454 RepID=UPI00138AF043|nr:hypothetical protein [Enterococcus pallens]
MVYLLLLLLGLVVLVQSYLLFSLIKGQQELQKKIARLLREGEFNEKLKQKEEGHDESWLCTRVSDYPTIGYAGGLSGG